MFFLRTPLTHLKLRALTLRRIFHWKGAKIRGTSFASQTGSTDATLATSDPRTVSLIPLLSGTSHDRKSWHGGWILSVYGSPNGFQRGSAGCWRSSLQLY